MGITIHYAGKAKDPERVGELTVGRAEVLHWRWELVNRDTKGRFYPNWGLGYGFVPSEEKMKGDKIEFFPKMVSVKCNGCFRIFDTPFSDAVRESLRRGKEPESHIDAHVKGIILDPGPKCESLAFIFDLNTLRLANYERSKRDPGVIYGYNSFWCKTQFARFKTHVLVCETIRLAERYVDFSKISDEAEHYHSKDLMVGIKNFCRSIILCWYAAWRQRRSNEMMFRIKDMEKLLNKIGKNFGLRATLGDVL